MGPGRGEQIAGTHAQREQSIEGQNQALLARNQPRQHAEREGAGRRGAVER